MTGGTGEGVLERAPAGAPFLGVERSATGRRWVGPAPEVERLGLAIRAAKAQVDDADLRSTWNILGDPSLVLRQAVAGGQPVVPNPEAEAEAPKGCGCGSAPGNLWGFAAAPVPTPSALALGAGKHIRILGRDR